MITFKQFILENKYFPPNIPEDKILQFNDDYDCSGVGGDCGNYAISLNKHLGGIGEYYGAINPHIWSTGDYWLGHVALKIDDTLFDLEQIYDDIERFKSWGQLDEQDDAVELYNLSTEDVYDSEAVNLSQIWGDDVERKIMEWTK